MPGERTIDSMDNQTKPRSFFNALPRPLSSSPGERNQALIIYPGGADLNALSRPLSSIPGERTSMIYLGCYLPSRRSRSQCSTTLLSSIPGEQIFNALFTPLPSIPAEKISMLHLRLHHPSRGSRS